MLPLLLSCAHPVPPTPPPVAAVEVAQPVLELDGTPEITAEMAARLRPYLSTRSAGLRALSDDGEQVLISTRFGEASQLHRLTTPMGARSQLAFQPEPH